MAEKKKTAGKAASAPKADKPAAAKAADKGAKGAAQAATPAAKPVEAKPAPAPVAAAPVAASQGAAAEHAQTHGFRRKLVGKVTSNKMNKTVTVEVIRNALDPVYKKYVRVRDRYKAHDETNQYKVGDRVEIQEHRPISRDKRWLVTKLVARSVGE
jgi:small subunit ribosomal protein S17